MCARIRVSFIHILCFFLYVRTGHGSSTRHYDTEGLYYTFCLLHILFITIRYCIVYIYSDRLFIYMYDIVYTLIPICISITD